MPEPIIIYEKREPHTVIIKLNRPEKKNSISRELYNALADAWKEAKADDDGGTVTMTGAADSLCAGGDLKENTAAARGQIDARRFGTRPYSDLHALDLKKPVIA